MLNLLFDRPAPASTSLVFGADAPITANTTHISISGQLPPPTLQASIRPVTRVQMQMTLPTLVGALFEVSYSSHTQRPLVAQAKALAQAAANTSTGITQPQQHATITSTGFAAHWQPAQPVGAALGSVAQQGQPAHNTMASAFANGTPRRSSATTQMQEGTRQSIGLLGQFQQASTHRTAASARMQDGIRTRTGPITGRFQNARQRPATRYQGAGSMGRAVKVFLQGRFQQAWVPRPGIYRTPIIPPVQPPVGWSTNLVFRCPPLSAPYLVFGPTQCGTAGGPGALLQIFPARFYMTAHTIYAQRLPDLADIPIFDATVSADSGSYCWSLSATGPASLFALLGPVAGLPAQLRVWLDGLPWVFAIDSISRSASFGKTGARIQGRSVTALISAPYMRSSSRIEPQDSTAQQLAIDALAGTGIDLDWGFGAGAQANGGLTDWLVPAGAYSRQGTPLEAVKRIAQAAGGYLQSHRSSPTLQTRHPYGMRAGDNPGAPWGWMTGPADVELAPDALITESVDRQDGPDINAVYVSGTSVGVLALVMRSGSAADKLADMVTDSLITHVDAARQKGLSVLGAAGHKYAVSLELPVLTGIGQPGVLDVGQLVQVNASVPWRGRVRAVSVNARRPSLRQSVTLERHLETTA